MTKDKMNESVAHEKSFAFSIRIVSLSRYLKKYDCEQELIWQILRSGTSIGANLAEASFAVSKKDFFSKVHIAQKECAETLYWLRLLQATDNITEKQFKSLHEDCLELMHILTATTKTVSKQL